MKSFKQIVCFAVVLLITVLLALEATAEIPRTREIHDKFMWGDPDDIATCRQSENTARTWDVCVGWSVFSVFRRPSDPAEDNRIPEPFLSRSGNAALGADETRDDSRQGYVQRSYLTRR